MTILIDLYCWLRSSNLGEQLLAHPFRTTGVGVFSLRPLNITEKRVEYADCASS